MKTVIMAGLLLSAWIAAVPAIVHAQQPPQVKIKVDDLDLTRDAGVRTANNRLKNKVDGHCAASGQDLHSIQDEQACGNDLLSKGRTRIAAAAAKSDADKLAEERSLAEVSIHPRRVHRAPAVHRMPGHVVVDRHPAPRHQAAPHKAARHQAKKHPVAARHAAKAQHRKRR